MNYSVTFDEIKLKREVKKPCAKCGKKLKRVISAWQTLNPYNVGKDGKPKTSDEIRVELRATLDGNAKLPIFCGPCSEEKAKE